MDLDLRPLSLGEVLDQTFSLYRRHFALFVGIMALTQLPNFAVNLVRVQLIQAPVVRLPGAPPPTFTDVLSIFGVGTLISVVLGVVAYLFSHGGTVFAVSEFYLGRSTTIGASLRRAWGKLGKLFFVVLLNTAAIYGALILLVVPGVYVACRSITCVPVAMLESLGPGESFSRSFRLTDGSAGRSFVIHLLYYFLLISAVVLLSYPFTRAANLPTTGLGMRHLWLSLSQVGSFLSVIFVGPVFLIAATVFYYDLRVRKEGFDLQLMMNQVGGTPPRTSEAPTTLA